MALEVHALMQNAHNIDARWRHSIKQHMRGGGILPIAGAHLVAGSAKARLISENFDRRLYFAKVDLGLVNVPVLDCIVPNFLDIGLSPW